MCYGRFRRVEEVLLVVELHFGVPWATHRQRFDSIEHSGSENGCLASYVLARGDCGVIELCPTRRQHAYGRCQER